MYLCGPKFSPTTKPRSRLLSGIANLLNPRIGLATDLHHHLPRVRRPKARSPLRAVSHRRLDQVGRARRVVRVEGQVRRIDTAARRQPAVRAAVARVNQLEPALSPERVGDDDVAVRDMVGAQVRLALAVEHLLRRPHVGHQQLVAFEHQRTGRQRLLRRARERVDALNDPTFDVFAVRRGLLGERDGLRVRGAAVLSE